MEIIAEQLENRGIERGIEKGWRIILRRQLHRRFGALPAEAVERLDRATVGEMEPWADRVLTAATLAEVLDG